MTVDSNWTRHACAVAALVVAGTQLCAQARIPAELVGEWVPQAAPCSSPLKLVSAEDTLSLVNGSDTQSWGNVGVPQSFFGPDYNGIIVVALPDFEHSQPFTVFFNADEKRGIAKVNIYSEIRGPMNPQVARIQAAAKRLAGRFPLNDVPLRKCPGASGG